MMDSSAAPLLELKNLTKHYPGTTAVNDVSLEVLSGEIHAIVGENGAGKSTLIKMIAGAVAPSSGGIKFNGKMVESYTPIAALKRGVTVIYQELNLVPDMSIAENIFLGREQRHGLFTRPRTNTREAQKLIDQWDIALRADMLVNQLSIAERQLVEIIKAISQDARLIIMDEPTASLTFNEVDTLFKLTKLMVERGVTFIYISHRLEEVFKLCDRVTVMRDGALVQTLNVAETNKDQLIRLMVGRTIGYYPEKKTPPSEHVALSVKGLSDGLVFSDVSFELRRGEIVGMYALIGAGRTDVALTLFGVKPRRAGKVVVNGRTVQPRTPTEAFAAGIGLVPEDRKGQGLVMQMLTKHNVTVSVLPFLSRLGFYNSKSEATVVNTYQQKLQLKPHTISTEVSNLSGGNQQKVVLAKILSRNADVIILDEPTRGIDVGAKHEIYELMIALCDEGKAVLMISSELPEILGMSDRVLVMREGALIANVPRSEATEEVLLTLAAKTKLATEDVRSY